MQVSFHPKAQQDLLEAQTWYETRAQGLGLEFARAFGVSLLSAVRQPQDDSMIESELRTVLMRQFPYASFYCPQTETLLVVAVFHHRRNPGLVMRRQKARPDPWAVTIEPLNRGPEPDR